MIRAIADLPRPRIEIGEPDTPSTIFIEHIVMIKKLASGCVVLTSDGSEHVFTSLTYREMIELLNA